MVLSMFVSVKSFTYHSMSSIFRHGRILSGLLSVLVVGLAVFLYGLTAVLVNAQSEGVSISPAVIEETIEPGSIKEYSIKVENLNSFEQEYYVFTRNISGVRDGGVPVFAKEGAERTGFEMADWITLGADRILIPARSSVNLNFTMAVPEAATPGSHFSGIFISVEPPDIEASGAAVGYQVANIISIRVAGDAIEEANIRQFATSQFLYGSQDVDFSVRIENTGNVLIRPAGPLEIYNMLGNKVGTLMFNEEQYAVFPRVPNPTDEELNGMREFELTWSGDAIGFGRYEAILSPVYGDEGAKKTMTSTVTFWILPMNIIVPALLTLAVLFLIIFVSVRLYIKRSLAHLDHGRRIVRRRKQGGPSVTLLILVVTLTVTALFLIVLLALFA